MHGNNLDKQVVAVATRMYYQLPMVNQLCSYLAKKDLASVTHALVTPRLDYCNVLYMGLPLKTL